MAFKRDMKIKQELIDGQPWVVRHDGRSYIDEGWQIGSTLKIDGAANWWENGKFQVLEVQHDRIRVRPVDREGKSSMNVRQVIAQVRGEGPAQTNRQYQNNARVLATIVEAIQMILERTEIDINDVDEPTNLEERPEDAARRHAQRVIELEAQVADLEQQKELAHRQREKFRQELWTARHLVMNASSSDAFCTGVVHEGRDEGDVRASQAVERWTRLIGEPSKSNRIAPTIAEAERVAATIVQKSQFDEVVDLARQKLVDSYLDPTDTAWEEDYYPNRKKSPPS